ncbi:uncharacterized protein BDW70DRAFT_127730 [Aspergillus foveolatus]|uniref:uncharacterized protein n=1 Tax=Aspergillus foveolatus TaxID=210207 RepID=UPI003CCD63F8
MELLAMVLEDLVFTRIASKCYVLPSYSTWLMYAVNFLSFSIFHSAICKLFWSILALLGVTTALFPKLRPAEGLADHSLNRGPLV